MRWKHDSDGDKNRHPKTALIRNENSLFPCFLLFFKELSKKRRKRINKPRQVIKDEYVEDDFFSIDDDDDLDFPEDWK